MTAGEPPNPQPWEDDGNLPKEASRLFKEVASGIDKNQTGEQRAPWVILFLVTRRICTRAP